MNYRDKLRSVLSPCDQHPERRQRLLATFLTAFERGGQEEAAASLIQELARMETTFAQKLADVDQLL